MMKMQCSCVWNSHLYNPNTCRVNRHIPGTWWSTSGAQPVNSRFSKRSCPNNIESDRGGHLMSTFDLHTHISKPRWNGPSPWIHKLPKIKNPKKNYIGQYLFKLSLHLKKYAKNNNKKCLGRMTSLSTWLTIPGEKQWQFFSIYFRIWTRKKKIPQIVSQVENYPNVEVRKLSNRVREMHTIILVKTNEKDF